MAKLWSYRSQRPGHAEVWVSENLAGYVQRQKLGWTPVDQKGKAILRDSCEICCHTRDDAARIVYAKRNLYTGKPVNQ